MLTYKTSTLKQYTMDKIYKGKWKARKEKSADIHVSVGAWHTHTHRLPSDCTKENVDTIFKKVNTSLTLRSLIIEFSCEGHTYIFSIPACPFHTHYTHDQIPHSTTDSTVGKYAAPNEYWTSKWITSSSDAIALTTWLPVSPKRVTTFQVLTPYRSKGRSRWR